MNSSQLDKTRLWYLPRACQMLSIPKWVCSVQPRAGSKGNSLDMLSYSTDMGSLAPSILPYRSPPPRLHFVLQQALPNIMANAEDTSHILMGNPLSKSSKFQKQSVTSLSQGKELFCPYPQRKLKCWLQQSINRDYCRCLSLLLN